MIPIEWQDTKSLFSDYWTAYGGRRALIRSPYLQSSILISFACYGIWSKPDWWSLVLSTLPSILGYTIAGFAVTTSVAITTVLRLLARSSKFDEPAIESPLMKLGAAFFHFILVQLIAFVLALLAKSFYNSRAIVAPELFASHAARLLFWGASFTAAIYAFICSLAIIEWNFRLLYWIVKKEKKDAQSSSASRRRSLLRIFKK